MSGWNLVNPLWWLTRPQQAVFGAADEGSRSFEKHLSEFNNSDSGSPITNTAMAFGLSIPEFMGGAYKAMNPIKEDVYGGSLTESFTENPWINAGLGVGMEFGADPFGAVNVGGKAIGTAYRTAKNLHKAEKEIPVAAKQMKDLFGWKRYLTDVPLVEEGHPVMFRDTPAFKHADIVPEITNNSVTLQFPDKLNGRSFTNKETIYVKDYPGQQNTLNHETLHWLLDKLNIWGKGESMPLFPLGKEFRESVLKDNELMNSVYGGLRDDKLGGEALARMVGDGNLSQVPSRLKPYAEKAITVAGHPGYMAPPPNVPLNVAYEISKAFGEQDKNPWQIGY